MHTHTVAKTHPLGRGGSRQRSAGRQCAHCPIRDYRQCRQYRQARCRLGDSMVQAVQHVMTSAAGRLGSAPNWWARERDVAVYPLSMPGDYSKA